MIDDGHPNQELSRQAQSLATLLHTFTLTSLLVPGIDGFLLRRTSRLLYENLSGISDRREKGANHSQSLNEANTLTSTILAELSAPAISSNTSEAQRSDLINACTSLLNSLGHLTGSDSTHEKKHSDTRDHAVSQSLRGKVVLITRPMSQSQNSVAMVENHGGIPVVIPVIEIVDPDDWYPVDHAIVNLNGYDGVIFTSQNGVERFLRRVYAVSALAVNVLATRRVYAVGEKTRISLENAQIPVTLMPETFSANELASSLRKESLVGKRFLFPKGSLAKEEIPVTLRSSNAVVDEIEVYKTLRADSSALGALKPALRNGEIDAIGFFSPSAIESFALAVGVEHTRESVIACVGTTTAEAAESAGFARIIIAPKATAESLIGTLVRYFRK